MQYTISHRMSDVHGSAIRELFKLGADPSMISFGGGNPSAETFPVPDFAEQERSPRTDCRGQRDDVGSCAELEQLADCRAVHVGHAMGNSVLHIYRS